MAERRFCAGNDEDGRPGLFEISGSRALPFKETELLERELELDGVLGEDQLGSPNLADLLWAVLPKPDGKGGVHGVIDVRAAVTTEWGPIWRPQVEVVVQRMDGEVEVDVDDGLVSGRILGDRIQWEGGAFDSHADVVREFLSQPIETARITAILKHFP